MAFKPYPCAECGDPHPALVHAPEDMAYFVYCDGCGHGGSPAVINLSGDENEAAARAVVAWNSEWMAKHITPLEDSCSIGGDSKGRKRI